MIPNTGSYRLTNVRLHASLTPGLAAVPDSDGFALADVTVADGKISNIAAHGRLKASADAVDLGGRIVLPCFVDCHTH
ncbi:cytosine deaminase, partial [Mesorhizobium sp. M7A.F.Ca.CA.002.09.1.1]